MADATVACPKCHAPVPEDSKFCAKCGASVSIPGTNTLPPAEGDELFHLLASATLGEYEIKGELGRGGMGAVYLAHEIALERKVAIKVLPPELTYGSGITERFKREARTAAHLNHPNIIPIFRVAEANGLLFFVMKYVEGRGLDHIIEQTGKLPIAMVHAILTQVGGALGYAHRRGVIHRDVKPANVMIDEEGWAVVTDFGIAKAASAQGLTATGAAIGTPYYMSPEQCAGKGVTGASDQYSLGIVTYQMLTGAVPFSGESIMEIMKQHFMDEPPDLAPLRSDCPPAMLAAVRRSLAKDPAERFPSLEDFVVALGAAPSEHEQAVRTQMIEIAKSGTSPVLRMPATPLSPIPLGRSPLQKAGTRRPSLTLAESHGPAGRSFLRRPIVLAGIAVVILAGATGTWLAVGRTAAPGGTGDTTALAAAAKPPTPPAVAPDTPLTDAAASTSVAAGPSAPDSTLGTVTFRGLPATAIVRVDGQSVNPRRARIRPGAHALEIVATGYVPFQDRIRVTTGRTLSLAPQLRTAPVQAAAPPAAANPPPVTQPVTQPAPSPTPAQPAVSPDEPGKLTVGSRPLGSATLNGSAIPRWPAVELPMLPGTYRLTIQASGFEDSTVVFMVRPGQTVRLGTIILRRREGGP